MLPQADAVAAPDTALGVPSLFLARPSEWHRLPEAPGTEREINSRKWRGRAAAASRLRAGGIDFT